ncbi:hypothetical protein [Pantoea agglomerans]|uniref:hypothetical protein n=1 Tax=Enterobacter agglomerans TaxID=549 RepID=UPI002413B150|nr:hypothetical protein [Pantoea agglomerans]
MLEGRGYPERKCVLEGRSYAERKCVLAGIIRAGFKHVGWRFCLWPVPLKVIYNGRIVSNYLTKWMQFYFEEAKKCALAGYFLLLGCRNVCWRDTSLGKLKIYSCGFSTTENHDHVCWRAIKPEGLQKCVCWQDGFPE